MKITTFTSLFSSSLTQKTLFRVSAIVWDSGASVANVTLIFASVDIYSDGSVTFSVTAAVPQSEAFVLAVGETFLSHSSISAARTDWGSRFTARRGLRPVTVLLFFTCYYDGNAALFAAAHPPKRSSRPNNSVNCLENKRGARMLTLASVTTHIPVVLHRGAALRCILF